MFSHSVWGKSGVMCIDIDLIHGFSSKLFPFNET